MKINDIINKEYADVHAADIQKVYVSENLSNLILSYKEWIHSLNDERNISSYTNDWRYNSAIKKIKNWKYASEDITAFSLALTEFQDEKFFHYSGHFISSLINSDFEKTKQTNPYLIITELLQKPKNEILNFDQLGFLGVDNNGANISIKGTVGSYLGFGMKKGNIYVKGDVLEHCAYSLEGGTILIDGDCGGFFGVDMSGGIVQVKGNQTSIMGDLMSGGKIEIFGNAGNIRMQNGGEIIVHKNIDSVGTEMKKGKVIIYGDAKSLGHSMEGGEIHLFGEQNNGKMMMNIKELHKSEKPTGGVIYHKEKRIFPQETIIEKYKRIIKKIGSLTKYKV